MNLTISAHQLGDEFNYVLFNKVMNLTICVNQLCDEFNYQC